MRILNAEPDNYSSKARCILETLGQVSEQSCSRDQLLELIPEYDVLIVRLGHHIDEEIFNCAKKLKVIVTATTGLNHIDLDIARSKNVEVLCLKGEREFLDTLTATAELTWALLLGLVRRVPVACQHVIAGGWDRDQFRGRQLKGKVLGVIGYGRLGSIVAEYGRIFRMKVLACDPFVDKMPDWVEQVDFNALLCRSDVITLHVNFDETTRGLLGSDAFDRMKHGTVLLNTSRGELVDEISLLKALESGRLAGAALDVLDGEARKYPDWPSNSPVWRYARSHDNLLLSPHVGGATLESMEETEIFMANKLVRFCLAT